MKNHTEIFCFITFHAKHWLVQNHCVESHEFITGLDIKYHLAVENY